MAATLLAALTLAAVPPVATGRGVPACAEAPCAGDSGPALLLSYYRGGRNLQRLIAVVNHAHLPFGVPVYYGDYWGSGAPGQHVPHPHGRPRPRMEAGRYAPIFTIRPSTFWARRRLPPDQRRALRHPRFSGRLSPLPRLLKRSAHYRYAGGLELGRRFRDRIRSKRAAGQRVVTWQLDELPSELAGHRAGAVRGFLVGVMRGIAYGRARLGDRRLPGIVFATPQALRTGARERAPGFWRMVNRVSLYVVGEEYPPFAGPPGRAAAHQGEMRRRLWRRGGARRAIARKYVAGMTPGYRLLSGLGGNVHRLRRGAVARWRLGFVRARARDDLAGFGQYLLAYGNGRRTVLRDVVDAMVRGARLLKR